MKKPLLILAIFSVLLTSSCEKDACINGVVLDSKTEQPIAEATVYLGITYVARGSKLQDAVQIKTDKDGAFSYCSSEKDAFIGVAGIGKSGYSFVYATSLNDPKTFKLTPVDGLLKLSVTNTTGTYDSLYAQVFNQCQYKSGEYTGDHYTEPYPLTLQQGETHTSIISTCAGDSSAIRWKFSRNAPWFQIDSILVNTTDTMFWQINY